LTIKKIAAGVLAAAAVAVSLSASAEAAGDPVTQWSTVGDDSGYAWGYVTWHNRTVSLTGYVTDKGAGWTVARFRAYANGRQIGPDVTRYTDDASTNPNLKSPRDFEFLMGDTNLPGGIDKVGISICHTETSCAYSTSVTRP
jgi:hypothetical protein